MEDTLRDKIIALFEYRQLPELIIFGGKTWSESYYEQLIDLQYHIYKLDHELETNWKVDMKIINNRWTEIYKSLDRLGISRKQHDRYCRHIYKYQKHELDIRNQKLPTRLSMEYFYFYKSCDVKLLRKLIYRHNPTLAKEIKESEWRLFDLVTEVNDDVTDLQEDIHTINGNRFLISLKQFGPDRTKSIFADFLQELKLRNDATPLRFKDIDLHAWTDEQIVVTQELLDEQIAAFGGLDTALYDGVVGKVSAFSS